MQHSININCIENAVKQSVNKGCVLEPMLRQVDLSLSKPEQCCVAHVQNQPMKFLTRNYILCSFFFLRACSTSFLCLRFVRTPRHPACTPVYTFPVAALVIPTMLINGALPLMALVFDGPHARLLAIMSTSFSSFRRHGSICNKFQR